MCQPKKCLQPPFGTAEIPTFEHVESFLVSQSVNVLTENDRKLKSFQPYDVSLISWTQYLIYNQSSTTCSYFITQLVSYVVKSAASTGSIQEGHVKDRINQSSMHAVWYICMHGRNRIGSSIANSTIQMTHSLFFLLPS